ncbi:MAG: helix-turn-helix domain-containing protein [Klebsiella pneumoniae]|jgi:putative transcriptional regulator|nr:helix-turn-helix domain-containing protein [Klebsiella pneumoniae]
MEGDLMIRYYKLFDMLNRKGLKKTDLLNVLTSGTLAKLGKGNNIRMDMLDKICSFLDCQPGDIMEYVEEEEKLKV